MMPHPARDGAPDAVLSVLAEQGIRQVVSLLEPAEADTLGLAGEAALVEARGMAFEHYPVGDFGVPREARDFARLARRLHDAVKAGQHAVVHCRGGIGRSGMLVSAVLLCAGLDFERTLATIGEARGRAVPESDAQRLWLLRECLPYCIDLAEG